jgi:hypothetical protein
MSRIPFAVVMAVAIGPSAHASVCTPHLANQHWYAQILKFNTARAQHGAAINLETTTLTSGSPAIAFVNHEMWYGVTGNCSYWVEVGVKDGMTDSALVVNQAVFWADNRSNGGGYHEHYPAVAWKLGAYYQLVVQWAGGYSWNVYFGGVHLGTSTNNPYGGVYRCLQAGIEATRVAASDHVGGHMYNWLRKDTNNVWYHGWDGGSYYSDCPADIDASNGVTTEVLHGPN